MRWSVALLATLFASPVSAFEGEIDARALGATGSGSVDFAIVVSKKGDVRMDTTMKGPPAQRASYIKPATGKYDYALDHQRKQAMKVPKQNAANAQKSAKGAKDEKANIEVKKLGTEKIAGQPTRHIQIIDKDDGHTADVWLSDQYPATLWHRVFSSGKGPGGGDSAQWSKVVQKQYGVKPGFVMKVVSTDEDGKKAGLEVTRMQKKKVSPNAFRVPKGYDVVEAPAVPAGMPNMKAPATQEEAEKMRDEWMEKMKEMQKQQR